VRIITTDVTDPLLHSVARRYPNVKTSCILWLLFCALGLIGSINAAQSERRVDELVSARVTNDGATLQLARGGALDIDLTRVEVIDLRRPARPARRSLKSATAGMGVVIDFRRDDAGSLRFGRIFLTLDRAQAEAFMAREFANTGAR